MYIMRSESDQALWEPSCELRSSRSTIRKRKHKDEIFIQTPWHQEKALYDPEADLVCRSVPVVDSASINDASIRMINRK